MCSYTTKIPYVQKGNARQYGAERTLSPETDFVLHGFWSKIDKLFFVYFTHDKNFSDLNISC